MKIGLREAIILQQIYYWLTKRFQVIEGRSWTYNTYKDWQKQFPFWSKTTIKRSILNLEKQGLLLSGNWNIGEIKNSLVDLFMDCEKYLGEIVGIPLGFHYLDRRKWCHFVSGHEKGIQEFSGYSGIFYEEVIEKLRKSQMRKLHLSEERLDEPMPYWYNKIYFFLAGIMILFIDFFIWYSGIFNSSILRANGILNFFSENSIGQFLIYLVIFSLISLVLKRRAE